MVVSVFKGEPAQGEDREFNGKGDPGPPGPPGFQVQHFLKEFSFIFIFISYSYSVSPSLLPPGSLFLLSFPVYNVHLTYGSNMDFIRRTTC